MGSLSVCTVCLRAPAGRGDQLGPGWPYCWSLSLTLLQSRRGQCMCFPGKFPAVFPQFLLQLASLRAQGAR